MDISKYASEWLNAEAISTDKSKPTIATIKDEGSEYESKYGKQIVFEIEIDGRTYKYRPSKTSLRNIAKKYGMDTMTWLGKSIELLAIETLIRGEIKKIIAAF